jgi:Carbonic anhydrases/acetyltransferases, isoleucine patch superfamily
LPGDTPCGRFQRPVAAGRRAMMIRAIDGKKPSFGERVFVAENATIVGDVTLADDVVGSPGTELEFAL